MIELTKNEALLALNWITYMSLNDGDCAEQCERLLNTLSKQIESV